jgi:hypothetical protein
MIVGPVGTVITSATLAEARGARLLAACVLDLAHGFVATRATCGLDSQARSIEHFFAACRAIGAQVNTDRFDTAIAEVNDETGEGGAALAGLDLPGQREQQ